MILMILLTILLTLNIVLNHGYTIRQFYYFMYKKLKKPKFEIGEYVMINDLEYEIQWIVHSEKPYTYYCLRLSKNNARIQEYFFHESEIKKKSGLLKGLE